MDYFYLCIAYSTFPLMTDIRWIYLLLFSRYFLDGITFLMGTKNKMKFKVLLFLLIFFSKF